MYQALLNQENPRDLELKKGHLLLNGAEEHPDIRKLSETFYHVVFRNRSFYIEILEKDEKGKALVLRLNGRKVDVRLKDRFDLLLEEMGLSDLSAAAQTSIKAPMPGLILKVMVEEGQQVQKDQPLLILEAMKMENVLKAPADGTVAGVKAQEGATVEKNQVLLEF